MKSRITWCQKWCIKSGGSFAKGTNLKNDTDIDIFILIDKKVSESHFEGIAMDIGFKALSKYTKNKIFRTSLCRGFCKEKQK
jgi:tRNA nucleotidyltransferase (CCA-adding enzyme)